MPTGAGSSMQIWGCFQEGVSNLSCQTQGAGWKVIGLGITNPHPKTVVAPLWEWGDQADKALVDVEGCRPQ